MSEEPENLVLRYLRRIDERLDTIERKLDEVILRAGIFACDPSPPRCARALPPWRARRASKPNFALF
jgi:hypothetical protein